MKKSFSLAHSTSARLLIDSLRIASMGKKMLQREKGKMQTDSAVLYIWSAITELRWSIICLLAAFVLARRQQNWLYHGCAFCLLFEIFAWLSWWICCFLFSAHVSIQQRRAINLPTRYGCALRPADLSDSPLYSLNWMSRPGSITRPITCCHGI